MGLVTRTVELSEPEGSKLGHTQVSAPSRIQGFSWLGLQYVLLLIDDDDV